MGPGSKKKGEQMDEILEHIDEYYDTVDEILNKLPSDYGMALTMLCVCVDKYSSQIGMKGMDCWNMIYNIAKEIHETHGDYKEDTE